MRASSLKVLRIIIPTRGYRKVSKARTVILLDARFADVSRLNLAIPTQDMASDREIAMTVMYNGTHATTPAPVRHRGGMKSPSRGHTELTTLHHRITTAHSIYARKTVATMKRVATRRITNATAMIWPKDAQPSQRTLLGIISQNSLPTPPNHAAALPAHEARCHRG